MANYTRIKESTRRRAADIVAALEAEITAYKQAHLDIGPLERLLSCILSLKEGDLPRFRLSEAVVTTNPLSALALRNVRCQKEELFLDTTDQDLRLVEMALGRAPLSKYNGNSCIKQWAALGQAVQAHLQADRRVLILSAHQDESDRTVEALLRSCAQSPLIEPTSVIHISRAQDDNGTAGALSLQQALAAAQSAWAVQRTALESAAAQRQETCNGIAALLAARQALSEEIGDLNIIHQRCDQLLSYSQSISVHILELEMRPSEQTEADGKPVSKVSPWRRLQQCLLGTQRVPIAATNKELQLARQRRSTADQEADQMALEMISRQAFIADTTRQLLRRLGQYAPTFAEAAERLSEERLKLAELQAIIKQAPAPPTSADILRTAKLVCTTVDHLYQPLLSAHSFDVVVVVQANQLSTLSLYWAASLAKTAIIMCTATVKPAPGPLSGHQSARFWLGPASIWEPSPAVYGIKTGWVPSLSPPT